VLREEEQEKVEQSQETQCTQQNVTQCYNTYITKYKDSIREKCEDVFIKTCRIVMRKRTYNHTTRVCKRPQVKQCNNFQTVPSYGGYGANNGPYGYEERAPAEPETVCHTIYETQCNTTQSGQELAETRCGQVQRKICAEDNCRFVEGELECKEGTVENTIEIPEETCTMDPQEECKNVTTSIPQLIPEEICRSVPKEVCQAVFLDPKTLKVDLNGNILFLMNRFQTKVMVKYCTNPETGILNTENREEGLADAIRRTPTSQKLRQPKSGFNEDKKTDVPVKFLSNRERLLDRIN